MRFLEMLGVWSLNFLILAAIFYSVWAWGNREGIKEGQKIALKTNPVSEELEMTCLGLWLGEQNKKYMEKNK